MEECIICNKPTDNYIMWKSEDETECTPQYVCEDCMWESINKDKAEYKIKYDKALLYLKNNNYRVVVEGYNDYKEEFQIKDEVMDCVNIIRKRMKQQGFFEVWIDVHSEIYEECDLEIVDYLCFDKYNKTEKDERGHSKIDETQAFWIELTK
jgi:hypothetical protein